MFVDITERKQAEVALREAHDRLEKIIATAPGIVWSFRLRPDGSACFPYGGERIAEHYGVAPGILAEDAAPAFALVHPDDLGRLRETMAESARHLSPWRHEWRVRHPVRGELWIECHSMPLREPDGSTLWHGVASDITERKRAETALRETNDQLNTLIRASPTAIIAMDVKRTVLSWNPAAERLFGWTAAEVVGHPIRVVPEEERRQFETLIAAEFRGEVRTAMEMRRLRKDGSLVDVSLWTAPLRNASGQIVGRVGMFVDITERKRAEEALREAEARLRLSVAASNICLWDWNLVTNGVYFSPEWKSQLGYAEDEIPNRFEEWESRLHPDDLAPTVAKVRRFIEDPEAHYAVEFRMRHKNGSWRWIFTQAQIFRDEAGKPVRMMGCHIDITERKRVEAALRQTNEQMSTLIQASPIAIIALDAKGTVLSWNPAAERLFGWTAAEVVGHPIRVVPEEERGQFETLIAAQFRGEVRIATEMRRLRKDGSLVDVSLWTAPLRDASGQIVGSVGMIVDITERKRAEEKLRRSQAALEDAEAKAHLGSWDFDPATQSGHWSRGMFALFGRDPALGPPPLPEFMELIHPDDRPRLIADQTRVLESGESFSADYRTNPERAPLRVLNASFYPLRDQAGKVVRIVGTALDTTERKRAEEELWMLSSQLNRAEEEERRRIARELHDSTGQKLAALSMTVGLLQDATSASGGSTEKLFADCLAMIEQCAQEIRTHSYLLHPPLLDELGLAPAISEYAEGFSKRSGVQIALDAPPDLERLPDEVELALFRVVQESLGNIHRHADAATASIRLACDAEEMTLEVSDDGRGMSAEMLHPVEAGRGAAGVGIAGMRERLRLLRGRLEIESGERGTTVRAIVPRRKETT